MLGFQKLIERHGLYFNKEVEGIETVSKDFIVKEIEEMKKSGFKSLVIKNNYGTIVGICDLKVADEAYLSLLIF